jgi:hypothetical protein
MEDVLDVYTRPYDPRYPQVCMDEVSKQLLRDTHTPMPMELADARRYYTPGQHRVEPEPERLVTLGLL